MSTARLRRRDDLLRGTVLRRAVLTFCALASWSTVEATAGTRQLDWKPTLGGLPGADGDLAGFSVVDTGSGPTLYALGGFEKIGAVDAPGIARWVGGGWQPVGDPDLQYVYALQAFDDGAGPRLFAGGSPWGSSASTRLKRLFNGVWVSVAEFHADGAAPAEIRALEVFDDGAGPRLFVAGRFDDVHGIDVHNIARWDFATWTPLGAGMDAEVEALLVHDDGTGPALYAGGRFTTAGGLATGSIARWRNGAWRPLGAGLDGDVEALVEYDFGSGPELVVAGAFTSAGGVPAQRIARWDGTAWHAVGAGAFSTVQTLVVHDSGFGPELHAAGRFTAPDGPLSVARFDGARWTQVGGAIQPAGGVVFGLGSSGSDLWVGGAFTVAQGAPANRIARLVGDAWTPIGKAPNYYVRALETVDLGDGPMLAVGGDFASIDGKPARGVAAWDGDTWKVLATGDAGVQVWSMAQFDGGGVDALYVAGKFQEIGGVPASHIARWDGSTWAPLDEGVFSSLFSQPVRALQVFDDGSGPRLYVGGGFAAAGGLPSPHAARWDGTAWEALPDPGDDVHAFVVHDDGSGAALYAGGRVTGGLTRWTGSGWAPVPGIGSADFDALLSYDDGSGPALYGGAPGVVYRWKNGVWSTIGSIASQSKVTALAAADFGGGPSLFACGSFFSIDGMPIAHIARWDGVAWQPLGSGLGGTTGGLALEVFDDGSGPMVYVGGLFEGAGNTADHNLSRYGPYTSPFAMRAGCGANPEGLAATTYFTAGHPLGLEVTSAFASGLSLLLLGIDGTDANGCGLSIPGFGELLLAPAPAPVPLLQSALVGGEAAFALTLPADANLAGLEVAFQALDIALAPSSEVALSNALVAIVAP